MASQMPFSEEDFCGFIEIWISLGKAASKIPEVLKTVTLASALSQTMLFMWVSDFSMENSSLEDKRGKCKPALVSGDKMIARFKEVTDADPRVSDVWIAQQLGISTESVGIILRHKREYGKV